MTAPTLEAERAAPYQFRKKPVVVEAFQFQRRNNGPIPYPDWYDDAVTRNDIITHNTGKWHDPTQPAYCEINTLEGVMRANEGDWIIRGVKDEIYPCRADIFAATYEADDLVAEGVALPPLPEPDTHDAAGYRRAHSAEQVRQAQREAYELGKRASIDGQLTGAPSPVKQSIDTPEFAVLVSNYLNCRCNYSDLVAYIDGRTAGTAPVVSVPIEAYLWLMGFGKDAFAEDRAGAFWWRCAFNERAGLDMMAIYEASKSAAPSPLPPKEEAK